MSFEVDELIPVSRYWLGGYGSPEQCANDYRNLASTHQWRGNKTVDEVKAIARGMSPKKPDSDPLPQPWGL